MNLAELPVQTGWQAALSLAFERRGERSVLAGNTHRGPLRVQKALYPEGDGVCQTIVLHPPSGIAGGDQLHISASVGVERPRPTDHAGRRQVVSQRRRRGFAVHRPSRSARARRWNGCRRKPSSSTAPGRAWKPALRWPPTAAISAGTSSASAALPLASVLTMVVLTCFFGLTAAMQPIWIERGGFDGNDPMLSSPAGWAGATVCGTLLCTFPELPQQAAGLLEACRTVAPADGANHGADAPCPACSSPAISATAARPPVCGSPTLWAILRPACCGRPAVTPRIWNT